MANEVDGGVHRVEDVYVWLEQDSSIHIAAMTPAGDPVELSSAQARLVAGLLVELADEADR